MMISIFAILTQISLVIYCVPIDTAVNELNQLEKLPVEKKKVESKSLSTITLEDGDFIPNWPTRKLLNYLGQVSGLSFCPKGYLFIFHRADSRMDERSFNSKNEYTKITDGPIKENTIIKVNNQVDDPGVVAEFGSDLFYLPHGIFVNKKYMITTDLARHQVLRIPHNTNKPDLVLGKQFTPGNDESHFCKPTHAVIAEDGTIFVADGYCNTRIVKFDKNGKFLTQFGDKKDETGLSLPHHLVLIESKDLICVADRENMRVQCYSAGLKDNSKSGKLIKSISDERFGPIYAIGFNKLNNILYIVSGMMTENDRSRVFIYNWDFDLVTGSLDYSGMNGFGMAHTIDVCPRGQCLAVGSLTKECSTDPLTCLERENSDDDYQLRNLWLFKLTDEKLDLA